VERASLRDGHVFDDLRASCDQADARKEGTEFLSDKEAAFEVPGIEREGDNIGFACTDR